MIRLHTASLPQAIRSLLEKRSNFTATPNNIPSLSSRSPPRLSERSDYPTPNKRTPSEYLLTVPFKTQNHRRLTSRRKEAIQRLKEDHSIEVFPAHKGRASVVLEADTCQAKMAYLINNGQYQLWNKDSTERLTRKLSERLVTLKQSRHLCKRPSTTGSVLDTSSRLKSTVYRRFIGPMYTNGQLWHAWAPLHNFMITVITGEYFADNRLFLTRAETEKVELLEVFLYRVKLCLWVTNEPSFLPVNCPKRCI